MYLPAIWSRLSYFNLSLSLIIERNYSYFHDFCVYSASFCSFFAEISTIVHPFHLNKFLFLGTTNNFCTEGVVGEGEEGEGKMLSFQGNWYKG